MSPELLQKIYEEAIEEYRFNVKLAWDRTKFFILLSSALITAGIGLLKLAEGDLFVSLFLILFFLISVGVSIMGLETIAVGKRYYREAIFKKTVVERELGLLEPITDLQDIHGNRATLSIAVTDGQQNIDKILGNQSEVDLVKIPYRSIVGQTKNIFWAMVFIQSLGALAATISAAQLFGKL